MKSRETWLPAKLRTRGLDTVGLRSHKRSAECGALFVRVGRRGVSAGKHLLVAEQRYKISGGLNLLINMRGEECCFMASPI